MCGGGGGGGGRGESLFSQTDCPISRSRQRFTKAIEIRNEMFYLMMLAAHFICGCFVLERGVSLPPLRGLLFPISDKLSFMHHRADRLVYTSAFYNLFVCVFVVVHMRVSFFSRVHLFSFFFQVGFLIIQNSIRKLCHY